MSLQPNFGEPKFVQLTGQKRSKTMSRKSRPTSARYEVQFVGKGAWNSVRKRNVLGALRRAIGNYDMVWSQWEQNVLVLLFGDGEESEKTIGKLRSMGEFSVGSDVLVRVKCITDLRNETNLRKTHDTIDFDNLFELRISNLPKGTMKKHVLGGIGRQLRDKGKSFSYEDISEPQRMRNRDAYELTLWTTKDDVVENLLRYEFHIFDAYAWISLEKYPRGFDRSRLPGKSHSDELRWDSSSRRDKYRRRSPSRSESSRSPSRRSRARSSTRSPSRSSSRHSRRRRSNSRQTSSSPRHDRYDYEDRRMNRDRSETPTRKYESHRPQPRTYRDGRAYRRESPERRRSKPSRSQPEPHEPMCDYQPHHDKPSPQQQSSKNQQYSSPRYPSSPPPRPLPPPPHPVSRSGEITPNTSQSLTKSSSNRSIGRSQVQPPSFVNSQNQLPSPIRGVEPGAPRHPPLSIAQGKPVIIQQRTSTLSQIVHNPPPIAHRPLAAAAMLHASAAPFVPRQTNQSLIRTTPTISPMSTPSRLVESFRTTDERLPKFLPSVETLVSQMYSSLCPNSETLGWDTFNLKLLENADKYKRKVSIERIRTWFHGEADSSQSTGINQKQFMKIYQRICKEADQDFLNDIRLFGFESFSLFFQTDDHKSGDVTALTIPETNVSPRRGDELLRVLEQYDLEEFYPKFLKNGFDDLSVIRDPNFFSQSDLLDMGITVGKARKIMKYIAQAKSSRSDR